MAKFKFRLDSVINLKEEQKRQVAIELANAQKEKKKIENNLKTMNDKKSYILSNMNVKNNVQVLSFQTDYYYMQALDKTINAYGKKIERVKRIEDNIIKDIIRIDQSKKTIERLKDRRKEQFDENTKREDTNFLDEVSQRLRYQL
jgi:flagellar FliJ protein